MENLNIQAFTMWQQLEMCRNGKSHLNDLQYANGFYPLCGYCHVNSDCPKFTDCALQPQWEPEISKLEQLKERRSNLDAEIREIEDSLKLAHECSGVGEWINTGNHRFKIIHNKGRLILDRALLAIELDELFRGMKITDMSVESFLAGCERESAPSSRLSIQPLKKGN